MSWLIALGGLPGTGKTTIARHLAPLIGAAVFRIDTIEQALLAEQPQRGEIGPEGYQVAAALAEANLRLGLPVICDSVNGIEATRGLWRRTAARAGARLLEVEITCSDQGQHRARVEGRAPDIPGHVLPAWADVLARTFGPWPEAGLRLDSARLSPDAAARAIAAALNAPAATEDDPLAGAPRTVPGTTRGATRGATPTTPPGLPPVNGARPG